MHILNYLRMKQLQIELQMATLQQHNNELKYAKFVMKIANV